MTIRKRGRKALAAVLFAAALASSSAAADLRQFYNPIVQQIAVKHGVEADLIHAIIRAESAYDNFALSEKGAMGLMQLMPDTAAQYGVRNVFDAAQNIEGGTKYLKDLIRLYSGQTRLVLAAYNAGQEAVKRYGGRIPPYQETRDYIGRVMSKYKKDVTGRGRTPLYKVKDASGKIIMLTNDPELARRSAAN